MIPHFHRFLQIQILPTHYPNQLLHQFPYQMHEDQDVITLKLIDLCLIFEVQSSHQLISMSLGVTSHKISFS